MQSSTCETFALSAFQKLLYAAFFLEFWGFSAAVAATSYDVFRLTYRKDERGESAVTYAKRRALFESRKAQVMAHNGRNASWKLALNHFADFTDNELRSRLGYKRAGGRWAQSSGSSSFVQTGSSLTETIDVTRLASSVDWRHKVKSSSLVHEQGGCGSCWAHAAIGALEAHADIHAGQSVELSTQELIDCTDNPRHCGGTGGCHGATAELAFERARLHGISREGEYDGGSCDENRPSVLKVENFIRLPENKASHLMNALATAGPVATSVDAENLFMYANGVFSGCEPDAIVNHAVLTMGYGNDGAFGKDYWLIKNSWGPQWGEEGYFRLERHLEDDAYCGIDRDPKKGVYCDDAPPAVRVCGMCGSTSDSAYPIVSPSAPASLEEAHLQDAISRLPKTMRAFRGHQQRHTSPRMLFTER